MSSARSRQQTSRDPQRSHGLELTDYLDELNELRTQAVADASAAGELALKTLDRFLADFASALGMNGERPSMGDSLHFLERQGQAAARMAAQAERLRNTRNALAHNPDVMLRPEAGERIIESAERIIRMAAENAFHLAHRTVDTISKQATVAEARERLLELGHRQLIVVDEHGRLVDLFTYRDLVVVDVTPEHDLTALTVEEALQTRDYCAAAPVARGVSIGEVADILADERLSAAVITENGKLGERPLGIITRGDLLRHR
jgi:predicted transcriptional regulator